MSTTKNLEYYMSRIVVHVWVDVCHNDKVAKMVAEKLLVFENMEQYHEYMATVAEQMLDKGLAYNGCNDAHYYNLMSKILTPEAKRFVFAN